MGMLFKAKCPNCWDSYDICTCCTHISRCPKCFFPFNNCVCNERKKPMSFVQPKTNALGKITPIKAYQTTDGKKFVGERAREDAEDHQRWLDNQPKTKEPEPRKTLLKKRKKKRRRL